MSHPPSVAQMSHPPSRAHAYTRTHTRTHTPRYVRPGTHARAYIQNKKTFLQNESGTNHPQQEQNKKQQKKIRLKTTTYKIVENKACIMNRYMQHLKHRKRQVSLRVGNKPLILRLTASLRRLGEMP